jgi:hypothetical protein
MPHDPTEGLSRRGILALSTAAALVPAVSANAAPAAADLQPYSSLLRTWCDGIVAHQVSGMTNDANGGFLCPSCAMVHGRSADAVYPLLRMARTSGDARYVRAAVAAQDWGERNVSRPDGSWVNDVFLNDWKGTTVFRAIALSEALLHHGDLLDAKTREAWRARLAARPMRSCAASSPWRPATSTIRSRRPTPSPWARRCSGAPRLRAHARELAHQCLDYFTPNGLLFGEGHPQRAARPRAGRPSTSATMSRSPCRPWRCTPCATKDQAVLDQVWPA